MKKYTKTAVTKVGRSFNKNGRELADICREIAAILRQNRAQFMPVLMETTKLPESVLTTYAAVGRGDILMQYVRTPCVGSRELMRAPISIQRKHAKTPFRIPVMAHDGTIDIDIRTWDQLRYVDVVKLFYVKDGIKHVRSMADMKKAITAGAQGAKASKPIVRAQTKKVKPVQRVTYSPGKVRVQGDHTFTAAELMDMAKKAMETPAKTRKAA